MTVWEYKTIARDESELLTDEQLSKIGALGLELVAVFPLTRTEVIVGKTVTKNVVHYFFKRPKPAQKPGNAPGAATGSGAPNQ